MVFVYVQKTYTKIPNRITNYIDRHRSNFICKECWTIDQKTTAVDIEQSFNQKLLSAPSPQKGFVTSVCAVCEAFCCELHSSSLQWSECCGSYEGVLCTECRKMKEWTSCCTCLKYLSFYVTVGCLFLIMLIVLGKD